MDYLILVNRFEPLSEDFEKTLCLTKTHGKLFEKQTAKALDRMLGDALSDGLKIEVISGHRTAEYQQMLWEKEISKLMGRGLDYKAAVKEVGKTLALPRCSEHETGLAADLAQEGQDDVSESFAKTPQSVWLEKNAHRYGFILRYPRLKEHITGIAFEPWHYRYVGAESAAMIKRNGICLEEFLDFYQDKYLDSTKSEV
jgi:D-alanyl-D-alanine carboxypeptidase